MKKLLSIIVLGVSFCVNSFAMSPEFKKEIFDGCYLDAKSTLGNQRAKQYCTCTTEMLHRKFSDEEILRIGQKVKMNRCKHLILHQTIAIRMLTLLIKRTA